MTFPTALEIAELGALLGAAYDAFPILAMVVGLIFLIKGAPVGLRWLSGAFGYQRGRYRNWQRQRNNLDRLSSNRTHWSGKYKG